VPFTSIVTFVVTIIICSQVPNNYHEGGLPELSDLGTGQAHNYFMGGFIILLPQLLIMFIGRIQFLIQSQTIILPAIIYLIHIVLIVCGIFILIMAIASEDVYSTVHLVGAIGTFTCIVIYCIFHTIVILYLYIKRSKASHHSNVVYPLWFLVSTVISFIASIILVITNLSISQYIAVRSPFLYFLAFVPQFWTRAKQSKDIYCIQFKYFTNFKLTFLSNWRKKCRSWSTIWKETLWFNNVFLYF
jgi:hypothetical protein